MLNICYERENVTKIIAKGCVLQLVKLISEERLEDYKLMASVVGAIQSIVCIIRVLLDLFTLNISSVSHQRERITLEI
jgi:hypothetical protein